MKLETLDKANDLDTKMGMVRATIKQIQTKLETGNADNNWGFENVEIASIPMGIIQIPVDLAEKYLTEILARKMEDFNSLSAEFADLQDRITV